MADEMMNDYPPEVLAALMALGGVSPERQRLEGQMAQARALMMQDAPHAPNVLGGIGAALRPIAGAVNSARSAKAQQALSEQEQRAKMMFLDRILNPAKKPGAGQPSLEDLPTDADRMPPKEM